MNRRGLFKFMAGGLAALCGGKLLAGTKPEPELTGHDILADWEQSRRLQEVAIRDLRLPDITTVEQAENVLRHISIEMRYRIPAVQLVYSNDQNHARWALAHANRAGYEAKVYCKNPGIEFDQAIPVPNMRVFFTLPINPEELRRGVLEAANEIRPTGARWVSA